MQHASKRIARARDFLVEQALVVHEYRMSLCPLLGLSQRIEYTLFHFTSHCGAGDPRTNPV